VNVVIFNVKYSPNLGDGVIAECLEEAIARRTGWAVRSIDLAGRTRWSTSGNARIRRLKLAALQRMPRGVRDALVEVVLGRTIEKELRPGWRAELECADAAIIGGGQLFQDGDLNFPIKLSAAGAEIHRRGIPAAIYAVGASPSQSAKGRALFAQLFHQTAPVYLAARDARSADVVRSFGYEPKLGLDPGLLASGLWPARRRSQRSRFRVGLGITHPVVLSHHASGKRRGLSVSAAIGLYQRMAQRLADHGYDVVCFTNGAAEDEGLKDMLETRGSLRRDRIAFAPRSKSPEDLARLIAHNDAIVSHRLHAAILAYSYGVPAIGLLWDEKLASFFQSIGHPERAKEFDDATTARIEHIVGKAIADGLDQDRHARIIGEAETGIDELVAALERAVAAPKERTSASANPPSLLGAEA